ncbi:TetR/AcrR family transcriptional regulator [Spiractinospora alimapuensis]|uniref:TetR/AcrR family transcriptional regulator n=1 Tax=Spiractinospora alimapuensis TaxID=2820884 RepID=UPI001F3877E3|nr:TetR family transcriptional regulator [Spiractinospora alimapuensis]
MTVNDAQPGLRERKKRATRLAMERAAVELAIRDGLDNVTVDDIAAAADVSTRTFFNYFSSKDDALVGSGPPRPGPQAWQRFVDGGPSGDLITDLKVFFSSAMDEDPREVRVFLEDMHRRKELLEREPQLMPQVMAVFAAMERFVTESVADRLGDDPDDVRPQAIAMIATGTARLAMRRAAAEPHSGAQEFTSLFEETFATVRAAFSTADGP